MVVEREACEGSGSPAFHRRRGELFCEDVPLRELAERFGTPLYVYSAATVDQRLRAVRQAFGPTAHVCYAVKSNSNLTLLQRVHQNGAGFDLVSGGELRRLEAAGVPTGGAVFAGVAKQRWEIEAAARAGILFFNVESPHELPLLAEVGAALQQRLRVALRLNPNVDANTHAYISTGRQENKFGVPLEQAGEVVRSLVHERWLELVGYHVHLGSQLRRVEPYRDALAAVLAFADGAPERREGLRYYDLGGGFGIGYGDGAALDVGAVADELLPVLRSRQLVPVVEPGRYVVGDAGVLVTRVLGQKTSAAKRFLLVDAAMNDLLRPALYQAHHPIVPVAPPDRERIEVDVVGPVCETGDFLARQRELPRCETGDLLAVLGAGAYGASMASNYNTRPRPAEVLVDGGTVRCIRRRESFASMFAAELGDPDVGQPDLGHTEVANPEDA